jgi:hypothetical protein
VRDRRCGQAFEPEAVTDLTAQILSARCEPWKWPPGVRPRLKGWKDGISRLIPKPSVMELLEAGDARAGCGWRTRSGPPTALQAKVESYAAWLRESADDLRREMERLEGRIDGQTAMAGELERVMAIVKPVMDEDPSLTIGEALKVMAARGCEAARWELDLAFEITVREMVREIREAVDP